MFNSEIWVIFAPRKTFNTMAKKKKNEKTVSVRCNNCAFYSDEKKCCFREGGKLFNVKPLEGELLEATHDCGQFEEARYVLTPKGILSLALSNAGIEISTSELNEVWGYFADTMERSGYIKHDEENDGDKA